MSKNPKTIVPIIVMGIVLAAGIIGGVSVLQQRGILPAIGGSSNSVNVGQSPRGSLVLMIHDPPHVPQGVSALYVSYSGLSIRNEEAPDGQGWINLNQSGLVNLLSVVNFTETIANVQIQDGKFDLLRMNITSALVTYNDANYSASIAGGRLTIGIEGGIELNETESITAALVDISPTVLLSDSQGAPSFALISTASAYVVPKGEAIDDRVGDRQSVEQQTWLTGDEDHERQGNLSISAVTLTNSSLSLVVRNTGSESAIVRTIFIASNTSTDDILSTGRSMIFSVLGNGTLVPLGNERDVLLRADIPFGYNISAQSSSTFTFSGSLNPLHYISATETSWSPTVPSTTETHFETTTQSSATANDSSRMLPVRLETQVTTTSSAFSISHESSTTTSHVETSESATLSGNLGTEQSNTESHDSSSSWDSESLEWSTIQIVAGQTYLVGVISGESLTSTQVVAS